MLERQVYTSRRVRKWEREGKAPYKGYVIWQVATGAQSYGTTLGVLRGKHLRLFLCRSVCPPASIWPPLPKGGWLPGALTPSHFYPTRPMHGLGTRVTVGTCSRNLRLLLEWVLRKMWPSHRLCVLPLTLLFLVDSLLNTLHLYLIL